MEARKLLEKYQAGQCNEIEKQWIERWLLHYRALDPATWSEDQLLQAEVDMWAYIEKHRRPNKAFIQRWRTIAAAVVFLFLSIGGYLTVSQYVYDQEQEKIIREILPGGHRAILTLEDGQKIDLSDAHTGIIMGIDHVQYDDGTTVLRNQTQKLTLTTPIGGQYQVTLPDGTKVWLNTASTLRYPSRFSGSERRVELAGEAYFEVARLDNQGFIVVSPDQEVKVLGTHFNINTYTSKNETVTTLLEGSVQVAATIDGMAVPGHILTPGQQSVLTGKELVVTTANIDKNTAWKAGKFKFEETELREVMTQLRLWYNVDIIYQGNIPLTYFYGEIDRSSPMSDVLEMLKRSGLKFTVKKDADQYQLIILP